MSFILRTFHNVKLSRRFQEWKLQKRHHSDAQTPISVTITKHRSSQTKSATASNDSTIPKDETKLVDLLMSHTENLMRSHFNSLNIVAFSGGVDSSLAAALVHQTFMNHQSLEASHKHDGRVIAVLGVSSSLPQRQLELARKVASHIGVDLQEVKTTEGTDEEYIANKGKACFVCKTHLYSALEAVSQTALLASESYVDPKRKVVLYNGTNADDTQDPTRLGLIAAHNFQVQSPLLHTTKEEVRRAARHLGLPNWDYAASPCLRSRLALGVEATAQHLEYVQLAEERVKSVLHLSEQMNMRVRMLAGKKAMIELDEKYMMETGSMVIEQLLKEARMDEFLFELGFIGGMGLRSFKSGAVSL